MTAGIWHRKRKRWIRWCDIVDCDSAQRYTFDDQRQAEIFLANLSESWPKKDHQIMLATLNKMWPNMLSVRKLRLTN